MKVEEELDNDNSDSDDENKSDKEDEKDEKNQGDKKGQKKEKKEKPKISSTERRARFTAYLIPLLPDILMFFGFMALAGYGETRDPEYIGLILDKLTIQDYEGSFYVCLWYLATGILAGFCTAHRNYYCCKVSEKLNNNIRNDLYRNVLSKDIEFFDEQRTGKLLSVLDSDVHKVKDSLSHFVNAFGIAISRLTFIFYYLFRINVPMAL